MISILVVAVARVVPQGGEITCYHVVGIFFGTDAFHVNYVQILCTLFTHDEFNFLFIEF